MRILHDFSDIQVGEQVILQRSIRSSCGAVFHNDSNVTFTFLGIVGAQKVILGTTYLDYLFSTVFEFHDYMYNKAFRLCYKNENKSNTRRYY